MEVNEREGKSGNWAIGKREEKRNWGGEGIIGERMRCLCVVCLSRASHTVSFPCGVLHKKRTAFNYIYSLFGRKNLEGKERKWKEICYFPMFVR